MSNIIQINQRFQKFKEILTVWHIINQWLITHCHNGKLVSPTAGEKLLFLRIIYKRSELRKVSMDLLMAMERSRSSALVMESAGKLYLWQKACINICRHILKFSNCVLVRVLINNYNYDQPIALFLILAKNTFTMV